MNPSERFWDKTASHYDRIEKKDERTYIDILNRTRAHLQPSDMVMDFGCGTGLIANEIAECVQRIHAIDTSSRMIEIAERKAKDRNIANISYARTTIFDERYKIGSFDVILVFHVLHLLEDVPLALHRMNNLLKPGGLWISATPCVGEKIGLGSLIGLAGRLGLMPKIRSFKKRDLVAAIEAGNFTLVELDCLNQSSREYFVVAKKDAPVTENPVRHR